MQTGWRKWWPWLKAVLVLAILLAVGRQFGRDLQRLDLGQRTLRWGWLFAAGAIYLLGLALSALYWYRLLRGLGQHPSANAVIRSYYLGHLGKYLPGKAWAVMIRTTVAAGAGVRLGVAVLSTFYEVLVTMTAGALLAAVVYACQIKNLFAPLNVEGAWQIWSHGTTELTAVDPRWGALLALLLLAPCGLPLIPAIFNRLVARLTQRFRDPDASPLPHARPIHLLEGVVLAGCGWLMLGASLWATLQAVLDEPQPWEWSTWLNYSAALSLAYVAGFVIVIVPGGLGVREFCLTLFLAPELVRFAGEEAPGLTVLAVLLLRLVWTAAEFVVAG